MIATIVSCVVVAILIPAVLLVCGVKRKAPTPGVERLRAAHRHIAGVDPLLQPNWSKQDQHVPFGTAAQTHRPTGLAAHVAAGPAGPGAAADGRGGRVGAWFQAARRTSLTLDPHALPSYLTKQLAQQQVTGRGPSLLLPARPLDVEGADGCFESGDSYTVYELQRVPRAAALEPTSPRHNNRGHGRAGRQSHEEGREQHSQSQVQLLPSPPQSPPRPGARTLSTTPSHLDRGSASRHHCTTTGGSVLATITAPSTIDDEAASSSSSSRCSSYTHALSTRPTPSVLHSHILEQSPFTVRAAAGSSLTSPPPAATALVSPSRRLARGPDDGGSPTASPATCRSPLRTPACGGGPGTTLSGAFSDAPGGEHKSHVQPRVGLATPRPDNGSLSASSRFDECDHDGPGVSLGGGGGGSTSRITHSLLPQQPGLTHVSRPPSSRLRASLSAAGPPSLLSPSATDGGVGGHHVLSQPAANVVAVGGGAAPSRLTSPYGNRAAVPIHTLLPRNNVSERYVAASRSVGAGGGGGSNGGASGGGGGGGGWNLGSARLLLSTRCSGAGLSPHHEDSHMEEDGEAFTAEDLRRLCASVGSLPGEALVAAEPGAEVGAAGGRGGPGQASIGSGVARGQAHLPAYWGGAGEVRPGGPVPAAAVLLKGSASVGPPVNRHSDSGAGIPLGVAGARAGGAGGGVQGGGVLWSSPSSDWAAAVAAATADAAGVRGGGEAGAGGPGQGHGRAVGVARWDGGVALSAAMQLRSPLGMSRPSTPAHASHAGASPSGQGTASGHRLLATAAAAAAAAAAAVPRESWTPQQDGAAAAAVVALAQRRRAALPTRAATIMSMSTHGTAGGGGGGTASAAGAANTDGGSSAASRWDEEEAASRRGQGPLGRGRASSRVQVYPNELYDTMSTDGKQHAVTGVTAVEGGRGQSQPQREERQQGMGVVVSVGGTPLGSRGRRVAELVARNQRMVEQLGARQRQ